MNDLSETWPPLAGLLSSLPGLGWTGALAVLALCVLLLALLSRSVLLVLAGVILAAALLAGMPAALGPDDLLALFGTVVALILTAAFARRQRAQLQAMRRDHQAARDESDGRYNALLTGKFTEDKSV